MVPFLFLSFKCLLYTCRCMTCVFLCIWRPEVNIRHHFQPLPILILRHCLSMNLELTELDGQRELQSPVSELKMPTVPLRFYMGVESQTKVLSFSQRHITDCTLSPTLLSFHVCQNNNTQILTLLLLVNYVTWEKSPYTEYNVSRAR